MAERHKSNGHALANGNAKLTQVVEKIEEDIYQEENIFLFIPNIIGEITNPSNKKSTSPGH
jgi:hypothetical protein